MNYLRDFTLLAVMSCSMPGGAQTAELGDVPVQPVKGASAELPSADSIVAGLKEKEDSIFNLVVTTTYDKLFAFQRPAGKEVRLKFKTQATVTTDGRIIEASEGELSFHHGTGAVHRGQTAAVHNGKYNAQLTLSAEGKPQTGLLEDHASWYGNNPLEFTIYYFGKPISKELDERNAVVVGNREWDGHTVVLVETSPVANKQSWKTQYWVDVDRNYTVVRRASLIQYRPDGPWQEYTRIEGRDHREIKPGIWLPTKFKYESVDTHEDGREPKLSWRHEGTNENWRVNEQLPDDTFELEFPPGLQVTDRRTFPAK